MAKQYTVIVTSTQAQDLRTHKVAQNSGDKGKALRIKAKAGETYQLVELQPGQAQSYAPQQVKVKRVGKDLVITFEGGSSPDIVIEGYYDVMPKDHKGLIGLAEDGNFYEYIPEDPHPLGMVQLLPEGGQDVAMALGAGEIIAPAEAAIAAFPLLGALGLLGGAAAVAAVTNKNNGTTTTSTTTGKLSATSDTTDGGGVTDNRTHDNTPTLTGTAPVGSAATVTINGTTYPVTVATDGSWTFQQPTNLPDGTYYPVLHVTQNGVTTNTNITPFTIDTVPPAIAITSNAAALASGQTSTITFTLSEATSDFTAADVQVTGGTLSNFQRDPSNPLKYTATFTPDNTGTSASIHVDSGKFQDAAGNLNTDGAETNNTLTLKTNASVTGALTPNAPNDSGTLGDNLTNDNTPTINGKVPVGSTATVTINGQTYPVTVNPDGTYSFTNPTGLPDGTYTPILHVTTGGTTTDNNLTPFTIDTVPPTVAVTADTSALVAGKTANVTFTLSEPVADFTAADVAVTGGTLSNFQQSATDPKIWTATFTPSSTGTSATISVASTKFSDAAGNFNTDGADANNTVTLATNVTASGHLAPASDNATGIPNDNKTNDATPELAGNVPAGSTATVTINGQTYPVTVNPDGSWSFTQPTNLPDGTYNPVLHVTTNGVTTDSNITPFTIDTVPPTVAITGSTSALAAGQSTVLTFTLSEASTDLTDTDIQVSGGTLGHLQQSATNPLVYTATFTAASGSTSASVHVGNYVFSDAAGNLNADGLDANNTWSISTNNGNNSTDSSKTALSIDPITGDNVLTATEGAATLTTITGHVTGKFAPGDTVTLTLNNKPYTASVAADGSYQVKVTTTDLSADSDKKIEGTVTGTGGSVATAAQTYTVESSDVVTKTALSINPVTPDNVLSSNETGTIAITGKVTGKFAAGDTVTLTVNGKTFSGTVDAGGSYSIGVPATDLNADSDTQVDGTVTGSGGTTAVAIQNYALDSSNPTPTPPASLKTALSLNPVTGDNILSATEQGNATTTLTGKVTGTFVAGDVVTLKINGTPYTASVAADGSYSVSVQTADLKADSDHKIDASVTGTNGSSATAAQSYVLENNANVGKITALTIDPVTADNIIGSSESAGSIAITGKVTGAFAVGDTVTLTINGKNFSGTVAAGGTYSIPVPAADLLADSDTTIDGKVTGTGGSAAVAMQDYGIDPNINPAPAPSVKTALSINPITGDNIINSSESGVTTTVVTGKVTGTFAAGDVVTLLVNNKTYTGTAAADGSYSIGVPTADLTADADTKIEGSVTGGNGGQFATAAQDYVLDASSPSAPTKTALSIDPVTADNMISDAENTGSINLTGTVTGKFVAGDKVTLTVNGHAYTGVADAAGKFTIPVLATNLVADSDTQVDGTVTGTGGTLATALQNYGLNITNPAPAPTPSAKTAIAIDPITSDNILNSGEQSAATTTVTGKVTGVFAAGDTVTLNLNGQTFTTTVAADGSFSKAIATSNFTADADTKIEGSVTGTGGSYASAAQDYTLDANAPTNPTQTALSIDKVTADNIIGVSEATSTITLSGHVTGKFAAGDIVTLVINGHNYTAAAAADGSYSVAVPAYELINDPDTTVDGTVTGTGGTTAAAMQNYGVDSHVPVNPTPGPVPAPTLKTALSIDAITGDNIVNATDAAQSTTTITGHVTGTYAANDIVTLTLNGKDYTASVAANGSYSVSVSTADLTNDADTKIEGSVTGTNGSFATAAQDYDLDSGSTPSKTALSIDPVTADNIIGSGENTGSINITGHVTGAFSVGDQVTLTINGKTFQGTATANGSYSISVPAADLVADTDTTIEGSVHGTGGTTAAAIQNYGIDPSINPVPPADTTSPTIIVERTNALGTTLTTGSTETITFTLSEASTNFDATDVTVTGGTLSNFVAVPTSGSAATGYTKYTAVFTPTAGSTGTATIGVASGKFTDNAGNANQDTYLSPAPTGATTESNNVVSVNYNTTVNPTPDTVKPNIQVSIDKSTLANGQSATLTFILSEASSDFTLSDVTVISGGGTVSNLVAVPGSNGAQYTATYTAGSTAGTVQIGVAETAFHDAAGNANVDTYKGSASGTSAVSGATPEANNFVTLSVTATDTTVPTIAITRSGSGTVNASGETIVFTFSEGVTSTSFTLADIDPVGGTMSNLTPVESSKTATGVYTQYTATFTPTSGASGVASVGVLAGKFQDAAGNLNHDTYTNPATGTDVYEANNQISFNYNATNNPADTTAPTIAISADKTTLAANGSATITFTLSEASTDFAQSDVQVTGGTLSGWTQVNSTTYTATFTPTGGSQTTGSVHVDNNAFSDAAHNYNTDGAEANNTVNFIVNNGVLPPDTTAPTIAIARLGSGTLSSAAGETIQFTLSEASKDFTLADIDVNGGTLSNLAAVPTSGSAGTGYTTYVATFIPASNSTTSATIGVLSNKFSDAAGNFNHDTYTNPATGTDVYEANNLVTIPVNTVSPSTDTTPPTVIVARAGSGTLNAGGTDTITFILSEPSLTFDSSDVTVSGGTLSGWTMVAASGTPTTGYAIYTAVFTPTATSSGTATIGVQSDKFTDAAGNINKDTYLSGVAGTTQEANNQVSIGFDTTLPSHDTTAPTVEVVRSATGTITGPETIYFNFSEATTDFALTDITATGGTMSNLVAVAGSGNKQYIATFTPTASSTGTAAIGVKAGTFSDAAGNFNKDTFDANDTTTGAIVETNNQVSAAFDTTHSPVDTTPPTVAISRAGTGAVTSAGETIVFVFSEPVSNFTTADIVDTSTGNAASGITNLVAVAGSNNTQFTALYTPPTGSVGTVTLGVKAGTFNDAAGNNNLDTYSATADSVSGHVVESNNQLALTWNTDTITPTIGITRAGTGSLTSGTDTITFTLSEASSDFAQSMVDVVGGTLSNWTKVDATHYTATFTPNSNSTGTATIGVLANKFHDLANNANLDTYQTGQGANSQPADGSATANQVSITFDTRSAIFGVTNDTGATTEGLSTSTTAIPVTGNVLSNDNQATTVTAVGAGTGSGSSANVGTTLAGTYGTLTLNANGTYTYTLDNTKASVQALKAGATVNDIFTYTARDSGSTTTGNANLVITITGTNDAPVVTVPLVDQTATIGTAMSYAFDSGTFTDVDAGDTATYTAQLVDSNGALVNGGTLPTWLTFNASTRTFSGTPPTGSAGTIYLKVTDTDGSSATASDIFSITINNATQPTSTVVAANDTATAVEAGGTANATAGTNLNVSAANGVLANDTGSSIHVSAVAHGTTTGTVGSDLIGTYGTLHLNADGSYTYVVDNNNATVQAMRTSGQSVTDSFSYTISDGTNTSTATLSVNVLGANDAPVYTANSLTNQSVTAGSAMTAYQFATTAFTDVDTTANGETATYTATLADGSPLPSWLSFNASTRTFSGTPPANTPAGTITVKVIDTDAGGLTANGTFNINIAAAADTTAPKVAISSNQASLAAGQTATITFTLSEASSDFTWNGSTGSITLTGGGTLSAIQQDPNNPLVYTATYTPAANATGTVTIHVADNKFHDAANNANADGSEADNTVTLTVNTSTSTFSAVNDVNSAAEDGVAITGNVMTNDALATSITKVNFAGGTDSAITASTTSANGTTVNGTYGVLKLGADGSYTYTIDNTKTSVQALAQGQKVTEAFTYTATDGSGTKTANLTITITGANDAPVAVADTASATEAGGINNATAAINPSGNVLTNDTDVDTGDTKTVSAIHTGSATGTTGDVTVSTGTTSATGTSINGTYGTLKIGADGSYTYTMGTSAAAEALLPTDHVTDVFTYTVKDANGATSQQTITVNVTGANDAPVYTANSLSNQTVTAGNALSYQFVTTAFTDVDSAANGETATYTATLADGSPLPSWLTFNATTRTFSGTPPANTPAGTISVKVIDTDAGGLTANGTFNIVITAGTNNTTATIDIVSATTDSGSSSTDFVTNDQTLTYSGTVTNWVAGLGDRVMLEFTDGNTGNVTRDFVTPNTDGSWTWTDTSRNAGTHILKATIVSETGTTAINTTAPTNGTGGGYDVQPVVIDTSAVNGEIDLGVQITTDANNDTVVSGTELAATSNSSVFTARATFNTSLAKAGMIITISDGTHSVPITLDATTAARGWVETTFAKPLDGATMTVTAKLTDLAGNVAPNTVSDYATLDETPPTVIVSSDVSVLKSGETALITFTLSEPSTDFTWDGTTGDIVVTGGTLSAFQPVVGGDGRVYTAIFTPTAGVNSGSASISVAKTKFSDAAGNFNVDDASNANPTAEDLNNKITLTYDTAAPTQTAAFSSMTKDTVQTSGTAADWTTADLSAGRLVSGTLNSALGSGDSVEIWVSKDGAAAVKLGTARVASNGTSWAYSDLTDYSDNSSWTYSAKIVDAAGNAGAHVTTQTVTTVATTAATTTGTALAETLSYTSGTFDALAGNDIITVASTTIGTTLATAGNHISGGAGMDTLQLAVGTTLDLSLLTSTQTVKPIDGVEIFHLQGTSTLTMTANDVLSLGGANNSSSTSSNGSVMAPYSFASTTQTTATGLTLTGSTTSVGKIQLVVDGTNTDTLNLGALLSDGITTNGQTGNNGLGGTWEYKGTVVVNGQTFKAFDHSTTAAQVLVDTSVNVNTLSPITIASISDDTGTSSTDFVTKDNTLTYTGKVPADFVDANHDVLVEILDSNNNVVRTHNITGTSSISNNTWTWTDPGSGLADGSYTIRATIVNAGTSTATSSYGTAGVATQPMVIDTSLPTMAVSSSASSLTANQTATITFTLSEASSDFIWDAGTQTGDISVSGGTLGALVQSSTDPKVYTATFTPTPNKNVTGVISVASTKFSDAAGNFNADGADPNNTTSISVVVDAVSPTVGITRASGATTAAFTASEQVVFTFSEKIDPTSFTASDLDLVGCTVAGVSPDLSSGDASTGYTRYTATVVPTGASGSTVSVAIAAGKFTDIAGNQNLDTYSTASTHVNGETPEGNNIVSASYEPSSTPKAAYAINGYSTSMNSGLYVSNAGDVNGDGLEDVIIGPQANGVGGGGPVWVVFGTSNAQPINLSAVANGVGGFMINPKTTVSNDYLERVSNAGDINGDGLSDLIVQGAETYVVYGKTDTAAVSVSTIALNAATAQNVGFQIIGENNALQTQSIGDFNGDGIDDLIIANTSVSSANIIFGKHDNAKVNLTQTGGNDYISISGFGVNGYRFEAGGDVNGDGLDDVVLFERNASSVYVVYGNSQPTSLNISNLGTNGYKIAQTGGTIGAGDVAILNDMNGDGLADIVYDDFNTGIVHVVYGQTGNGTITVPGASSTFNVGNSQGFDILAYGGSKMWAVETAGDFNGDGLADLLIGNPSGTVDGQAAAGNLYLVYGRADAPTSQIKLTALAASDGLDLTHSLRDVVTFQNAQIGRDWAFSTAGDMNGDGFDDLIIGQFADTPSGTPVLNAAGVTYIVYGGQYGGTTASKIDFLGSTGNDNLVGTSSDEQFVGGRGDDILTGNGGADSMIGAAGNDTFVLNADNVAKLALTTGTVNAQVDGGTGFDTLKLDGSGITLDLTALPSAVIKDVEHFDITGSGNNVIKLSLNDVIQHGSSNLFNVDPNRLDSDTQLMVTGNAGDTVQLKNLTTDWVQLAPTYAQNGHTYAVYDSLTSHAQLLIDQNVTVQNF